MSFPTLEHYVLLHPKTPRSYDRTCTISNPDDTFENDSEDQLYEFNIQSKISNKFADINQKYLDELGSLGLSNRIKNLDKIFENNI